jgi:hypothetical protein
MSKTTIKLWITSILENMGYLKVQIDDYINARSALSSMYYAAQAVHIRQVPGVPL